jgi:hypothetical protein
MRRQLAIEKESAAPTATTTSTIGSGGSAIKTVPQAAAQVLTSSSAYMRDMEQYIQVIRNQGVVEIPTRVVKVIERVINPDGSETVTVR